MPRNVDGWSTIYHASRVICRMVGRFGTVGVARGGTPEFVAAVAALVVACQAFEALDDQPFEVDQNAPAGKEDLVII